LSPKSNGFRDKKPLKLGIRVDHMASHVRGPSDIQAAAALAKAVGNANRDMASAETLKHVLGGGDLDEASSGTFASDGRMVPDIRLLHRYELSIESAKESVGMAEQQVELHDERLKQSASKRLLRLLAAASKRLRDSQSLLEGLWDKQKKAVVLAERIRKKRRRSSLARSPVATRRTVSSQSAEAMQHASEALLAATKSRSQAMGLPEVLASLELGGFYEDGTSVSERSSVAASPAKFAHHSKDGPSPAITPSHARNGSQSDDAIADKILSTVAASPGGSSVATDPVGQWMSELEKKKRKRRRKRMSSILAEPEEAVDAEQALCDAANRPGSTRSQGAISFASMVEPGSQASDSSVSGTPVQQLPAFTPASALLIRNFAEQLLPAAEAALREAASATETDENNAKEALNQQRLLDVAEASASLSRAHVRLRTVSSRLESLKKQHRNKQQEMEASNEGDADSQRRNQANSSLFMNLRRIEKASELVSRAEDKVERSSNLRSLVGVKDQR